jgi:hypothetical protein
MFLRLMVKVSTRNLQAPGADIRGRWRCEHETQNTKTEKSIVYP